MIENCEVCDRGAGSIGISKNIHAVIDADDDVPLCSVYPRGGVLNLHIERARCKAASRNIKGYREPIVGGCVERCPNGKAEAVLRRRLRGESREAALEAVVNEVPRTLKIPETFRITNELGTRGRLPIGVMMLGRRRESFRWHESPNANRRLSKWDVAKLPYAGKVEIL